MKPLRFLVCLFVVLFVFNNSILAQRGAHQGHRHPHKRARMVKRSVYRPARVVVYQPRWRPNYAYHRRWVYFPRHNFYWDNWRNHYVFWNGSIWLSQATAPAPIVNLNLEKEKAVELKETEDDQDDIYNTNQSHKTEYKED
jgi:hypothetical protein